MLLNFNQKKIINLIKGPCLVLAGAGSGKTNVITNKITHLVKNSIYKKNKIVAITFTNKAANEMQNRLNEIIEFSDSEKVIISTFHSFGLYIIKSELNYLDIKPNFSILDESDKFKLLKDLTSKSLNKDKNLLIELIKFISKCKNSLISYNDIKLINLPNSNVLFIKLYKIYDRYLKCSNILDFDDLIFLPTLLFKTNKLIREKWRNNIDYLLIDEYQDTNSIQYEMIKMIINKQANFTFVGDDDQSIYSWRGARSQNFQILIKDFPHTEIIKMEQNYRSSKIILNAANILISNNHHIFSKKLFSNLDNGSKIKITISNNEELEAISITKIIAKDISKYQTNYRDYAILYRNNYQSKIIEKKLIQQNLPYQIYGNNSLFESSEIKDIISYMKLVNNFNDDVSFLRIINRPKRNIGLITIKKLSDFARISNVSLFKSSFHINFIKKNKKNILDYLNKFTFFINKVYLKFKDNPVFAFKYLIKKINYENWLKKNVKDIKKLNNIIGNLCFFYEYVLDMFSGKFTNKPLNLDDVITNISLKDIKNKNIKSSEKNNKVNLMTLHSSKGLEFPFVIISGLEEGILPHKNNYINNIEEERRLFYVGITRAQKKLFFTLSNQRFYRGININTRYSRFLFELPQNDLLWNNVDLIKKQEKIKQDSSSYIFRLKKIIKNINN
ncbi:UvrD-helicase domain-containing protein [Buchnera aphidicola (Neophyllaphis podocarpi)]|uniref:UvrD-helicase domain-containing protein n=1 Tax=Buchnera aphidicola TaxID=9 RepID=UPI0031B874AE